mgnify:CR=1 FL=1
MAAVDLEIARRYAQLAGEAHQGTFESIVREYERTVKVILELKGTETLLEKDTSLRRSIQLRSPYIDPLSLLQVDLLARWRAGDRRYQALEDALKVTVRGIARGMQNTG